MLHVFCGSDTVAVRVKALAKLAPFEEEGIVPVRLESEQFEPGVLEHLLGGVSLFGEATVCVLDTPSEDELFLETVTKNLAELATSAHTFVLIDTAPLADYRRALQKSATSYTEIKAEAKEKKDTFALGNAFSLRDKKALWIVLTKELRSGTPVEMLVGSLWWQLKSMRLAACTNNFEEAGMSKFPYEKAKAALRKYSLPEVERMSLALLKLYQAGHAENKEKKDMAVGLEKWVLRV
ncbi:hypothetical protein K2Q16_01110 [Patescibacteria group bacterium]|nr:hypothetical protein [Patescibacteria group bacterium]